MTIDEVIKNLFKTPKNTEKPINKGSIISFFYVGQSKAIIHDMHPLVIISDIFTDKIRGVNLHYLILPVMQNILNTVGGNPNFSYRNIKNDSYIVDAFRSFKRIGMSGMKQLDVDYLRNLISISRALNVNELERLSEQIRVMLNKPTQQPRAEPGEANG